MSWLRSATNHAGRVSHFVSMVAVLSALGCGSEPAQVAAPQAGSGAPLNGSAGTRATAGTAAGTAANGASGATSLAGTLAPAPAGTGGAGTVGASPTLPCAVTEILASKCQSCHGAVVSGGAPMPLVTMADLNANAPSNPSRKVFDLVTERVKDSARPMPADPTQRLNETQIAILQNWTSSGAQPGSACGTAQAGAGGGAGQASMAAGSGGAAGSQTSNDADIEQCYELRAHGVASPSDKTDYTVATGETYASFIFKAPWTTPVQGLVFRHVPDNAAVLHHWLLYSESASAADGAIDSCLLSGPTGFLCGNAQTRSLITGWAPGRGDFALPADVGLELPAPGSLLAVEFHYYNLTDKTTVDHSAVEVCVTSKFRPNTASVTWLGTESINVPASQKGQASGSCAPLRKGMTGQDPIHVLYSWPHMHKLGRHLTSVVNRADGSKETMQDGEFSFDFQVLHDSPMLINPGDTISTTCSFENTTNAAVRFGQSTTQEMCFNFTYAWPAHALDNPGGVVGGASNQCLH